MTLKYSVAQQWCVASGGAGGWGLQERRKRVLESSPYWENKVIVLVDVTHQSCLTHLGWLWGCLPRSFGGCRCLLRCSGNFQRLSSVPHRSEEHHWAAPSFCHGTHIQCCGYLLKCLHRILINNIWISDESIGWHKADKYKKKRFSAIFLKKFST